MKYSAVILALCYAASRAQVLDNNKLTVKNDGDDDRWIWGSPDENNNNKTENRNDQETTTKSFSELLNPCNYRRPPKPSFSAPGRKISDEKCEEYKWDIKITEEQIAKNTECFKESNKGRPIPPAAVGGRPTFLGEFPHMGAIGWVATVGGYVFKCGSTLISSKFVLTAAHCSRASSIDTTLADVVPTIIRLNDKTLFVTDNNKNVFTEDVKISRIIVHPEFKPPKKYFDIALMELQHEVSFSRRMQPACLWTKPDISDLGATLTGWGVLASGSYLISPELQAADVDIINSSICDELLRSSHNRHFKGLQEHQLCAGKLAGGVDACQGDSGGPLQIKRHIEGTTSKNMYYVIGVTSFGIGCALPNHPGIYTRVSSFIDWIEGYVWS